MGQKGNQSWWLGDNNAVLPKEVPLFCDWGYKHSRVCIYGQPFFTSHLYPWSSSKSNHMSYHSYASIPSALRPYFSLVCWLLEFWKDEWRAQERQRKARNVPSVAWVMVSGTFFSRVFWLWNLCIPQWNGTRECCAEPNIRERPAEHYGSFLLVRLTVRTPPSNPEGRFWFPLQDNDALFFFLSLWLLVRYGRYLDRPSHLQSCLSLPAICSLWNLSHHMWRLCRSVEQGQRALEKQKRIAMAFPAGWIISPS